MTGDEAAKEPSRAQREVGGFIGNAVNRLKMKTRAASTLLPRGKPMEGVKAGQWKQDGFTDETGHLPVNCPVRPLGYDGEHFYFEDTRGQVFNTGDNDLGNGRLQKLFAGFEEFLVWAWPSFSKGGGITGFKSEEVRRDLYAACVAKGAWTMTDMVRGRGAWRGQNGRLILHCGDHLWIDGDMEETGEVDDFFYVRRPPSLSPWSQPVESRDSPAIEIMRLLKTWNFERGDTDRMFILGWIGIAMLGGALSWRPSIFVSGDAGTGKSSLIGQTGLLRAVLGRMMISTTNASEAGLYQLVGHDSLPIAIDEMEGDEAPEQTQRIIKMARDAASGSVRIRGGQNHKGVEFQAQSSFLFSGIVPPPIPPASMTRLAMIQLKPLVGGGREPVLREAQTIGPQLLRILSDNWSVLQERLEEYYAILYDHGHNSRGQKTFGTFLAVADVMLGPDGTKALGLPGEDERYKWGELLRPEALPELEDAEPPWKKCIDAIMTTIIDAYGGGTRRTVAQEIERLKLGVEGVTLDNTREKLAQLDLGLLGDKQSGLILAVPNTSKAIGRALMDSEFGSKSGNGSWKWALRRGPPGVVMEPEEATGEADNRVRIAGRRTRCTFINLRQFNLAGG